MEQKIKHLEMIQGVINRMANCSFFIKGWCLTATAAILGFALSKDGNPQFGWTAVLLSLAFWLLDAYYLFQEQLFRDLFDKVRLLTEREIDFSMHTDNSAQVEKWLGKMMSASLLLFYLCLIAAVATIVIIAVKSFKN